MKMNKLVTTVAFTVALTVAAPSAFAITAAQAKAVKKAVTSAPVAEMPAVAAQLVKDAAKQDREAVAVTAVRAGIYKSRSSARLMVAAVAKVAPEVAGAVTRAASEMEAGQASQIASAAIKAAPSAKNEIVSEANRVPKPTAPATVTRVRGSAQVPATGVVQQSGTPINTTAGGNGSGSFTGATATEAPPAEPVDYTQPRT